MLNFRSTSAAKQLLYLTVLFCVSLSISSFLALLAMIPFTGIEILFNPSILGNYSDPNVIIGLKVAQIINATGTFVVPALLFAKYTQASTFEFLKLKTKLNFLLVFLAIVLSAVALPLINFLSYLNSNIQLPASFSSIENWMRSTTATYNALTTAFMQDTSVFGLIMNLFVMAFLAAFGEELFFRATLQQHFQKWIGNHKAIWLSAFIFSAIHIEFYGFIPRFLLGVMLGYLFTWSGSIWLPILVHFCNNAFAVIIQFFINRTLLPEGVDQIGSNNHEFVYTLLGSITTFSILILVYKLRPQPSIGQ